MAFDNIDRNRYYGKRKGDIVLLESYDKAVAEVVEYGKDNNRLEVKRHTPRRTGFHSRRFTSTRSFLPGGTRASSSCPPPRSWITLAPAMLL